MQVSMMGITAGQSVVLNLDDTADRVECVVAELAGRTARLVPTAAPTKAVRSTLQTGHAAYMVLAGVGRVVGYRGAAIVTPASDPLIEFALTD
jgi:hypothetical protein